MIIARHAKTGKIVEQGETIKSFRDEDWIFDGPDQRGRNRVYVRSSWEERMSAEFFPSVFDLTLETIE